MAEQMLELESAPALVNPALYEVARKGQANRERLEGMRNPEMPQHGYKCCIPGTSLP